jgi:hypothetical protein
MWFLFIIVPAIAFIIGVAYLMLWVINQIENAPYGYEDPERGFIRTDEFGNEIP